MKSTRLFLIATLGVILLPACGDWIYDEDDGSGAVTENRITMINASTYTRWAYINLHSKEVVLVDQYAEENPGTPPGEWDFALHRFDCKTNGGAVLETGFSTIAELMASGSVPQGTFVEDIPTDNKIAIDMSNMMGGVIVYTESDYNTEFSKWMDVDLSGMPPTYTPSNKVYLLRMKDGSMAAIRFTDFIGPSEVKGYISFDYLYPVTF